LTDFLPRPILTTMVVNIIEQLRQTGLSDYESRTYLALLEEHPLTAYEAAGQAGIPTSKIYGVMRKLEEKELVLELTEKGKKRYIPQEPEEYLSSYRFRMEKTLDTLSSELKKPRTGKEISYIWNLTDTAALMERAEKMISRARSTILLSVWDEEFRHLAPLVRKREAEGVKTAVIHFGPAVEKTARVFLHPIQDTLYSEKGGRGFTLVTDSSAALSGTLSETGLEGAWSSSRGFVTLAEDYIKHDIYIMKIVERFDDQLIRKFGEGYPFLRDIFHNEEAPET